MVGKLITWKPPNTPVSGYVVRYHAVGDVQGVELEVKVPYVTLPAYLKGKYLVEVCSNKKKSLSYFFDNILVKYEIYISHINFCQMFL